MDKVKFGLKIIVNLLKESLIIFIYMLMMGIMSFLILMINSTFVKVALLILVILFYLFMCVLLTKSTGEIHFKALVTGNIRRQQENSEDINKYCKTEKEYRFYKGFLIGIIISSLTYILLIIRLFISSNNIDVCLKILNLLYWSLLSVFDNTASIFYLALFTLLNVASCGFGYYLGAKKIMLQQEKLQNIHDEIYGKGK